MANGKFNAYLRTFQEEFGFAARVMVVSAARWEELVRDNPYTRHCAKEPKAVHAVICEGDPLFYGSYMHLHARLAPRFATEVVAGVTGMSGCWSAAETPIAQGEDVFSVLPALLAENELARRLAEADAAVIMKVGRHLPKIRRALRAAGRLECAIYVERGTMADGVAMPLAQKRDDSAPYFAVVLVPGWETRP